MDQLPRWRHTLAVVAHPDDESFGLGALISGFVDQGGDVRVLCLTRGEASTLGAAPDLAKIRAAELAAAGDALGVSATTLLDFPDGGLAEVDPELLASVVGEALAGFGADGVLVLDPSGITGHPDHQAATRAAVSAARRHGLAALGWALPTSATDTLREEFGVPFVGYGPDQLDAVAVDRTRQLVACHAHVSQAVPGSVLWRRLELLGDLEHLRVLSDPVTPDPQSEGAPA